MRFTSKIRREGRSGRNERRVVCFDDEAWQSIKQQNARVCMHTREEKLERYYTYTEEKKIERERKRDFTTKRRCACERVLLLLWGRCWWAECAAF